MNTPTPVVSKEPTAEQKRATEFDRLYEEYKALNQERDQLHTSLTKIARSLDEYDKKAAQFKSLTGKKASHERRLARIKVLMGEKEVRLRWLIRQGE